jgi:Tetracyclin repressor-like, C-terminal domain
MLDGLGLDAHTTMDILGTVVTHVMGAVIREAQEIRGQRDQELAEADLTAEELQAERERFRKWFEDSGRYPRITRLIEPGIDPDDPETRDERFEFGLDCVLDGIAARLQASRA